MKLIKIEGNLLSTPEMFFRAIGHLETLKQEDAVVIIPGTTETEKKLLEI